MHGVRCTEYLTLCGFLCCTWCFVPLALSFLPCTLWRVLCSLYFARFALNLELWALCSVPRTLHLWLCASYFLACALYLLLDALRVALYALFFVRCTGYLVPCNFAAPCTLPCTAVYLALCSPRCVPCTLPWALCFESWSSHGVLNVVHRVRCALCVEPSAASCVSSYLELYPAG